MIFPPLFFVLTWIIHELRPPHPNIKVEVVAHEVWLVRSGR